MSSPPLPEVTMSVRRLALAIPLAIAVGVPVFAAPG